MTDIVFQKNHIIKGGKDTVFSAILFEQTIENYPYSGMKMIVDSEVENAPDMPPFVISFYEAFADLGKPPTEDEFFDRYVKDNFSFCCLFNLEALKARALRAYPSFLRDYHFYLMCIEDGFFDDVKYCLEDDMDGIDLKVTKDNVEFNIMLFCDTKKANQYREKKLFRHEEIPNSIDLPLKMNKRKFVGDYWLYESVSDLTSIVILRLHKKKLENIVKAV